MACAFRCGMDRTNRLFRRRRSGRRKNEEHEWVGKLHERRAKDLSQLCKIGTLSIPRKGALSYVPRHAILYLHQSVTHSGNGTNSQRFLRSSGRAPVNDDGPFYHHWRVRVLGGVVLRIAFIPMEAIIIMPWTHCHGFRRMARYWQGLQQGLRLEAF